MAASCCQPEFEAWLECNKHNCMKGMDPQGDNPPTRLHVARAVQECGAVRKRLERCTARVAQEVLAAVLAVLALFSAVRRGREFENSTPHWREHPLPQEAGRR